ncbi:MAG: DUF92 domain-containing protein [Candidatus Micrarchaeota archaeon]
MVPSLAEYLIGIIFLLLFAIFAFKRDALTEEGTLTAITIGLLVFLFPLGPISGRIWFALVALFFLASFFVTKYCSRAKVTVNKEFAKGATRDLMQVFANGAGAAILAVIYYFYPHDVVFLAFAVVLATVNADTWATELGILSRSKPVLITNFKTVRRGVSGAVSIYGLLAAFIGSLLIALGAVLFIYFDSVYFGSIFRVPGGVYLFVAVVSVFGVLGSLVDSILGAVVQIMYYCKKCRKETERTVHRCGRHTVYYKGIKFFDNDVVNLISSLVTGLLAALVYFMLFGLK